MAENVSQTVRAKTQLNFTSCIMYIVEDDIL